MCCRSHENGDCLEIGIAGSFTHPVSNFLVRQIAFFKSLQKGADLNFAGTGYPKQGNAVGKTIMLETFSPFGRRTRRSRADGPRPISTDMRATS